MSVLPCLVSEIHGIIGEEDAECKRCSEHDAAETVLQSHQHGDAARQSAMEWWEAAWSEDMSDIETLISDQIYDHFQYLDDASYDDNDENRVHMEPVSKEISETGDDELYH